MGTKLAVVFASLLCAAPVFANKLSIVSGDNQTVRRGGNDIPGGKANFAPLTVALTSDAGKPIAGARVNFVCQSPNAMACQLDPMGGASQYSMTDAKGQATINKMGGNSLTVYYASGKFAVQAAADGAQPIQFHLVAQDAPAPPPAVVGAVMSAVSGDGQKAALSPVGGGISKAKFGALQVKVTSNGKPLPGVTVSWSCSHSAKMACESEPSGAPPTLTTTDGNGVATLNKMAGASVEAYYDQGPITVTASYGKASVPFHLTVQPETAAAISYTLSIVSGDGQQVHRAGDEIPGGKANFGALSVMIKDKSGNPVAGRRVDFICKAPNAMACQLDPMGGASQYAMSDSKGVATINKMGGASVSTYYASGKLSVEVSADGAKPISFTLTALDKAAGPAPVANATMVLVNGDKQKSARTPTADGIEKAFFGPLQVKLTANGKPLSGVVVNWSCAHPGKMACESEPSGASPSQTKTDGNGVATLNKMAGRSVEAYYGDGAITVTASYGKSSVPFHLTVGK